MYSLLFRRETSRRLRAVQEQVITLYLESRFPWLDAYSRPSREGLRKALQMMAEAVDRDDVTWYREYADEELQKFIAADVPPIAMLAAGDLLHEVVLRFLTPDQQLLVREIFAAERRQRQSIAYERVMERGA